MNAWARLLLSGAALLALLPASAHAGCVVTLAPSLGEMVADLLADDLGRLCGVTEFSDRPEALKKIVHVGRYDRLSTEAIVALKPELVIATKEGNARDQIQRLEALKVPVLLTSVQKLEDIATTLRQVGKALHLEERGEQQARAFLSALEGFKKRTPARPAPRVLLQLGDDPLIVAGPQSFLSQALAAVGASNALTETSGADYPRISREWVLEKQPDWILILALGRDRKLFDTMAAQWSRLPSLTAVQKKRVKILYADPLLRPNATLVEGLYLLEKALRE